MNMITRAATCQNIIKPLQKLSPECIKVRSAAMRTVKNLSYCFLLDNRKLLQPVLVKNSNRLKYNKPSKEEDDDEDIIESHEFKDERDSKIIKSKMNSMRADLILKAGLGLARNKVEVAFYESRLRVNGRKIPKKSIQLHVGDEIDIIKGVSHINPAHLVIARVSILSAVPQEENISITMRRFKSLLIDNYEGADGWKSSGN